MASSLDYVVMTNSYKAEFLDCMNMTSLVILTSMLSKPIKQIIITTKNYKATINFNSLNVDHGLKISHPMVECLYHQGVPKQ